MKKSKPLQERDFKTRRVRDLGMEGKNSGDILKELDIPERTQKPPSAELISRLNEMASRPPFSYLHKAKENDTR